MKRNLAGPGMGLDTGGLTVTFREEDPDRLFTRQLTKSQEMQEDKEAEDDSPIELQQAPQQPSKQAQRRAPQPKPAPRHTELWRTFRDCQGPAEHGALLYLANDLEIFAPGIELPPYWRLVTKDPPRMDDIRLGAGQLTERRLQRWAIDSWGNQSKTGASDLGYWMQTKRLEERSAAVKNWLQSPLDYPPPW